MSERELLHTDRVLVVEGKYDAARLSHLTDALILLTDGFGIYKDKKRQQLFKMLAKKNGLILFTDSDAAGFRIRTYITNLVGAEHVVQAYVPAIHGKEKRKPQPGKEGLLGVEGVDDAIVLQALKDALGAEAGAAAPPGGPGHHLCRPLRLGTLRYTGQRRAEICAAQCPGPAAPPLEKGAGGGTEPPVPIRGTGCVPGGVFRFGVKALRSECQNFYRHPPHPSRSSSSAWVSRRET